MNLGALNRALDRALIQGNNMNLKKPPSKARFKVRVFDLIKGGNKSFSVYENETNSDLTLDGFIERLKKEIE